MNILTIVFQFIYGSKFALITTDTRRVLRYKGKERIINDSKNKIRKLSEAVILAASGDDFISERIEKALQARHPLNLNECYHALTDICADLRTQYDIFKEKPSYSSQISIVGQLENGTLGALTIDTSVEEIPQIVAPDDAVPYLMLASPGDDVTEIVAQHLGESPSSFGKENEALLQEILDKFAYAHYRASELYREKISEELRGYALFFNESQELMSKEFSINLEEYFNKTQL